MKIGNLQSLPWYLRLVMFVAVAGVMYAGFWYFITRPTRAHTKELNDEIAQLLPKNAQAQIASQRLNEFRAVYKAREEEYEELKALLPEQRELTMVLQGVQDRARNNGLVLQKFIPRDDLQQENYSGKRIEVSVISSFNSLRAFFEQLAHYQRIVSITNFQLTQSDKETGSRTVEATFDLTAYYVSAEKLQKPAAQPPASSGQVPATAAPQVNK
ncbi:MAG TPA: type 4a pilus biogenesis protein PilO [Pyrinomonadaceae bacterium]|nr:type 4a pilus biogenesis protein PilO [Pyrinomonadaceae bacterium]